MEDTITTSTQQDSTPEWSYEFASSVNTNDTAYIFTPSGFNFRLVERQDVLSLLQYVLRGEQVLCPDGTRIYVDWSVPNGLVQCIDTDVWVNPNFEYNEIICEARELCGILTFLLPMMP